MIYQGILGNQLQTKNQLQNEKHICSRNAPLFGFDLSLTILELISGLELIPEDPLITCEPLRTS